MDVAVHATPCDTYIHVTMCLHMYMCVHVLIMYRCLRVDMYAAHADRHALAVDHSTKQSTHAAGELPCLPRSVDSWLRV